MDILNMIKDVIGVAQKADNIELYRQLLDINKEALDIQSEIIELRKENQELKEKLEQQGKIVRHNDGLYITIENDPLEIRYCAICWGNDKKLIQIGPKGCFNCETKWRVANR
jgi:hypothetical protein